MHARAGQAAVMDSRDGEGMEHFEAAVASAATEHDRLEALVGVCFAALELGRVADAAQALHDLSTLELDGIDGTLRKTVVQLVYASRAGGVQSALGIGSKVLPLLDDARDPVVATSFLNTYAHLLGLAAHYPDALSVAELEINKAAQYRLLFVRRHAVLIQAVSYSGLRDFAKAVEAVGEAEELAGRARDIHVAMHAAALRTKIALCRGEFDEALAHASREWERPASAPMTSEYLAYRALALACLGRVAESTAAADRAASMHASNVETLTLVACARAIAALACEHDETERFVQDGYAVVTEAGGLDALVTAGRAFPRLLSELVADPARREVVANLLARGNDFRLAHSLGIDLRAPMIGPLGELTPRERDVAALIAHGQTNLEIANALFISEATVKVHVRHILEKLNARTRTEVAARLAADQLGHV
jgi:DNA-binding CsgD family transcriptional regulator